MSVDLGMVRQMWQLLEPVHAILYYAPEVFARVEKLGFDTGRVGPATSPCVRRRSVRPAPSWCPPPSTASTPRWSASTSRPRGRSRHPRTSWPHAPTGSAKRSRKLAGDQDLTEVAALARRARRGDRHRRPPARRRQRGPAVAHRAAPRAVARGHDPPRGPGRRSRRGPAHRRARPDGGARVVRRGRGRAGGGLRQPGLVGTSGPPPAQARRAGLDERGRHRHRRRARRAGTRSSGITDELAAPAYRALGTDKVGRLAQLVMPVTMAVVGSGLLPMRSTLGMGAR